jgi:hypothetical protein
VDDKFPSQNETRYTYNFSKLSFCLCKEHDLYIPDCEIRIPYTFVVEGIAGFFPTTYSFTRKAIYV